MEIRVEHPGDFAAVRAVHVAAFGQENEANLVEQSREVASTFSFVAVQDGQVVGHIFFSFFSSVSVEGTCPENLVHAWISTAGSSARL